MSEQQSSSQTDRKREVRMGGGRHGVLRIEKANDIHITAQRLLTYIKPHQSTLVIIFLNSTST